MQAVPSQVLSAAISGDPICRRSRGRRKNANFLGMTIGGPALDAVGAKAELCPWISPSSVEEELMLCVPTLRGSSTSSSITSSQALSIEDSRSFKIASFCCSSRGRDGPAVGAAAEDGGGAVSGL